MSVTITQGSNTPLKFKVDSSIVNATAISIELFQNDQCVKAWDKTMITFNNEVMCLPISESETVALSPGRYILDGKYCVGKTIYFIEEIDCIVKSRLNKTVIGD